MQNQPKRCLIDAKWVTRCGPQFRSKMKAAGYDSEQIEIVTQAFIESNDINDLPEDIRCQFKLTTYVRPYPVTDELRKECIDYINETADEFEERKRSGEWPAREIEEKNGESQFLLYKSLWSSQTCEPLRDCINKRPFYAAKDPSVVGIDGFVLRRIHGAKLCCIPFARR